MASLRIATKKRSGDWIAFLVEQPKTWEAGKSELEALGRILVTLAATCAIDVDVKQETLTEQEEH